MELTYGYVGRGCILTISTIINNSEFLEVKKVQKVKTIKAELKEIKGNFDLLKSYE